MGILLLFFKCSFIIYRHEVFAITLRCRLSTTDKETYCTKEYNLEADTLPMEIPRTYSEDTTL